MCALFSALHPNYGWPVEEKVKERELLRFEFNMVSKPEHNNDIGDVSISFETEPDDPLVSSSKRLNHNASERDRRKKINSMYSSLRSVLPPTSRPKKLTIPATVAVALKYIPELQEDVKRMVQRKEELLLKTFNRRGCSSSNLLAARTSIPSRFSFVPTVSMTRLSDTEVMVQLTACRAQNGGVSDVLGWLENEGLSLMHASSSESHGRVERDYNLDSEVLSDELLAMYKKRRESFV